MRLRRSLAVPQHVSSKESDHYIIRANFIFLRLVPPLLVIRLAGKRAMRMIHLLSIVIIFNRLRAEPLAFEAQMSLWSFLFFAFACERV